jgi:putative ABC transport system permease protein
MRSSLPTSRRRRVRREGAFARPRHRVDRGVPEHGPGARREGRRIAPGQREGRQRCVSAARPGRSRCRAGHTRRSSGPALPSPGSVWADPALLDALALKVGDTLLLGDASLRIAQQILIEPDRGTGFSSFAPRVMLNEADLPATGLIQPASRVTYRLAVAAPGNNDEPVRQFTDWAEAQIKTTGARGMRIESLATGRPEMRQTLDRAGKFLNLVALLAGAACRGGGRHCLARFRQPPPRRLRDAARARASRSAASRGSTSSSSAWSGCSRAWPACCLALRCTTCSVWLLAGLVDAALPAPTVWPALFGIGVGLTPAARLRPAAGAAAGARAAACA